jgi:hypothetical protein
MAIKDNLVSYWNLDETGTNTRVDSHGSNDLGQYGTMSSTTDGTMGEVADFSGSSGLLLAYASQTGLTITGDITINCWFNADVVAGAFVSKWHHASKNQYRLTSSNNVSLEFATDDNCGGYTYGIHNQAVSTMSTGTWYMVTAVRTGTTSEIFRNGVSQGTATVQTSASCTADLSLGYEAGRNVLFFNGRMTRTGIWNSALSGAEVTELYNSGAGLTYSELDAPSSNIKSIAGLAKADLKSMSGLAIG